jgi:hypothetical protein
MSEHIRAYIAEQVFAHPVHGQFSADPYFIDMVYRKDFHPDGTPIPATAVYVDLPGLVSSHEKKRVKDIVKNYLRQRDGEQLLPIIIGGRPEDDVITYLMSSQAMKILLANER